MLTSEYASINWILPRDQHKGEYLTLDAWFIHNDEFTHVQFDFGSISPDFSVSVTEAKELFEYFKPMSGVKKIISFGACNFFNVPYYLSDIPRRS